MSFVCNCLFYGCYLVVGRICLFWVCYVFGIVLYGYCLTVDFVVVIDFGC